MASTLWKMGKSFFKPPESRYGQQVVHWVDGKVSHTQTTSTVKFKR